MTRLRVTLTIEYNAYPGDYGTSDPQRMAQIDQASWKQDPDYLLSIFDEGGDAKVEVV